MKNKIKVALFEDNQALRLSLTHLFEIYPEFELTGAYPNAVHIIAHIKNNRPDVIIMDIDMPEVSGIEATKMVRAFDPEIRVVMQTVFEDDEKVFNSIRAGAVGYMLKSTVPDLILESVKQAYEGGVPMTPVIARKVLHMFGQQSFPSFPSEKIDLSKREHEILLQLTNGLSYKMIAAECNISIDTVRFHVKNIYEKLHVNSMVEAVSRAIKDKLV